MFSIFNSKRRLLACIEAQQREINRLANENADLRRRLFAKLSRCRTAPRSTR
jgi:hypothetical protein